MMMREGKLDRQRWHRPLVSVVITHHNYSDHVRDALLSVLDQTHEHWECVVVDDASEPDHRDRLQSIVAELDETRISVKLLDENGGQIPAFFGGLDATSGEFVCLLDPDDRYAETFLSEALAAHLNPSVICPIVCTDQFLLGEHGIIAGGSAWHKQGRLSEGGIETGHGLSFIPPHVGGWHWTSTSSIMFRRSALIFLRPIKQLYLRSADAYLASGAHLLGGTIFLHRPLIYRQIHDRNSYISAAIISSRCDHKRADADVPSGERCKDDALEALIANGAPLPPAQDEPRKMRLLAKWRRSIDKRVAWIRREEQLSSASPARISKNGSVGV